MAYTQSDLDALQAAMAKGVRKLKMADEEVEFRTLTEMERMEARMKRELGQSSSGRVAYPQTTSGWR